MACTEPYTRLMIWKSHCLWNMYRYSSSYNMSLTSTAAVQVSPYSFFNLGTRCGWVVNDMLWLLYPQQRDPGPIVQDTRWATGMGWRGTQNMAPTRTPTPDHPARSVLLQQLCHLSTATELILNKYVCTWDERLCSSVAEDSCVVGCAAVLLGWRFLMLQRNTEPSSSRYGSPRRILLALLYLETKAMTQ
jgi:hypothetical protein